MPGILKTIQSSPTQDLTILATVKAMMDITDSSKDAKLTELIHRASDDIANYCNRVFGVATLEETFRGCFGDESVILSRFPVTSVTSVVVDGTPLAASEFEVDEEAGILFSLDGNDLRAPFEGDKVVVSYVAGFELLETLPRAIEGVAIDIVKLLYYSAPRDPLLRSVDIPGVISRTYWIGSISEDGTFPPDLAARLDRYRDKTRGTNNNA